MNDIIAAGANLPATQQDVNVAALVARESQAVQAAVVMARRFPRDPGAALKRIEGRCASQRLAEQALYSYPRGGTDVTGPSIRLAEMLAQNWGNLDFGWCELERRNGESDVEAWAWDLETNVRRPLRFKVLHVRDTRKGTTVLVDQRDIYELVANQASRRLRNCILAVIPGDVVEAAVEACEKTLAKAGDIGEKRAKIVEAFRALDVSVDEIERRLGKKLAALSDIDYVHLRKIWKSIQDGMSTKADWFEPILEPAKIAKAQEEAGPALATPADEQRKKAERQNALDVFEAACAAARDAGLDPFEFLEVLPTWPAVASNQDLLVSADRLNNHLLQGRQKPEGKRK